MRPESFFSNNQFAHSMGMFLGLLFRISGMLSAIKEKTTLSLIYGFFLIVVLLFMSRIDYIFYLYVATLMYSFVFVLVLKFRRSGERKARARSNRALAAQQHTRTTTGGASQVAIDLANGGRNVHSTTTAPSAPPFEFASCNNNNDNQLGTNPSELYFNPLHNTPPPSYAELYETK